MKKNRQIRLKWTFCVLLVLLTCSRVTAETSITCSSVEHGGYTPQAVFDGDLGTRWSSAFSDPQWIIIDLGEVKTIPGLTLFWEAAYAKEYEILLSTDKHNWKCVFSTLSGDGKSDEIFFIPTKARFIKILGTKRATTWGYSLWEIEIKEQSETPIISATESLPGSPAQFILDGTVTSSWKAPAVTNQTVSIDLRRRKEIAGLELLWGKYYPSVYTISLSEDGKNWREVFKEDKSNGEKDIVFFDKDYTRYIQISCQKETTKPHFTLNEIIIKKHDEEYTPLERYSFIATESPAGYFPFWLSGNQLYWTIIGLAGSDDECLIGEDGSLEPFYHGFSIIPYIELNGALITAQNTTLSQSLKDDYLPLPTVFWDHKQFTLTEETIVYEEKNNSALLGSFSIRNTSNQPIKGTLYITIRPFQINPPWQYGGLAKISSLEFTPGTFPKVLINNKRKILALSEANGFKAHSFKNGDIIFSLTDTGSFTNKQVSVDDAENLASGALAFFFELDPDTESSWYIMIPYSSKLPELPKDSDTITLRDFFNKRLNQSIDIWHALLNKVSIRTPEPLYENVMKSNLAYILINMDGFMTQPGSRNYGKSWMRDGAVSCAALLKMGYTKSVKDFVIWISEHQFPNGMIPFILTDYGIPDFCKDWMEYDSQGQFIYAVSEYYRFTRDKVFLERLFPSVIQALKYLEEIRKKRLTNEYKNGSPEKQVFYGILPESNSHEGYFPAVHSYWDDYWALLGWKDGQFLAKELGKDSLINWMRKEETGLRNSLLNSITGVMQLKNIPFIPSSAEKGDFDPTSVSIAFFPCSEASFLPQDPLEKTFNQYYYNTLVPRLTGKWEGGFTPYELRTCQTFMRRGDIKKMHTMLNYFFSTLRPANWNHWGEVVYRNYRHGQYIGDMPHTWIGAIYVTIARSMFVYEESDKLILAAGIPEEWFKEGCEITNAPTWFGTISFSVITKEDTTTIDFSGTAIPKGGFDLRLPKKLRNKKIKSNIQFTKTENGIIFKKLPAKIKIKD